MEEIQHQLANSLSMFIPLFTGYYTSEVVQDFFYQQFFVFCHAKEVWCLRSRIAEEDELIDGIKSIL